MTREGTIGGGVAVVVAALGWVTPARAGEESCFGRTATIVSDDDRIEGTDGDDVIVARGEVLLILAGGGDDLVCGGREVSIVHGGDGNDKLSPGEGNDWRRAYGDAGDDVIVGAVDSGNRLHGGDGNDAVMGGGYHDAVNGGSGADELFGGEYIDRLRGGPGPDQLVGGGDGDLLYPGPDDDSIVGGPGDDRVFELAPPDSGGNVGDEDIDGGSGRDLLWAYSYDPSTPTDPVEVDLAEGTASFGGRHAIAGIEDVVLGHRGPVRVIGDVNDNWIHASGSPGATIDGGAGDDTIDGGRGDDELDGGDGNDTVSYRWLDGVTVDLEAGVAYTGSAGVAHLSGFENIRGACSGGTGNDVLLGDEGPNRIEGGCGDDRLAGRGGNDILLGDHGMDTIDGGAGDDSLEGGDDDDSLDGGEGDDSLDGGDGTDNCVNGETIRSCEGPSTTSTARRFRDRRSH